MSTTQEWSSRLPLLMAGLLLSCAVVFAGAQGGQGMHGDLLCQLLALMLLGLLLLQPGRQPVPSLLKVLITLVLILPLTQWLIAFAQGHGHAAIAIERSLWSLLPALAMAWAVARLSPGEQRRLLALLLALALLSLVWGLIQRAQGPDSLLRLYRHTNLTDATGFFANRNHLASLLLMALPFAMAAAAWTVTRRLAGHEMSAMKIALSLALAAFLILGIAITRSRSGMLLAVLALVLSVPMVLAMRRQRGRRRVILAVSGLGLLLVLQFAFTGILQRLHRNPLEDARWAVASTTLEAARAHAPLGSGLGTFREVYAARDPAPGPQVINHAHNDWLELWLEGGWPFLVLAAAFLACFAWCGWKAWRARGDEALLLRTRAAWIGLLLMLLHAGVDYALRTTANMVVFALLLAVLLSGLAAVARSRAGSAVAESG